MCDISEQAVKYTTINATLNGVSHISIRLSDGAGLCFWRCQSTGNGRILCLCCREAKPDHKEEKETCKEIIQKITAEAEMLQNE